MYNFVIFSTPTDINDVMFNDIIHSPNVRYIRNIRETKNPFLKIWYKIHFSKKLNSLMRNPFKAILNQFLFKNDFSDNKPICFIFIKGTLYLDNFGFMEYLKNTYPNAKLVCFIEDLVKSILDVDFRTIIRKCDLAISYDKGDSMKYGIFYYPTPYSICPINNNHNIKPSDVYFLGLAKNRLQDIITVFEILKGKGLSCDFYITGVEPKDQIYANEIHYNTYLSYEENLQHVLKTKCLLEIMQQGSTGYTLRTWEAIMHNKLLLTNNAFIKQAPFYKSQYIQIYSDVNAIDISAIKNSLQKIDYEYMDKLSPKYLLDFIETKLIK